MGNIPHIIEAALLLLVAFLIGCIIGWFLRSKVFRRRRAKTSQPAAMSKKPAKNASPVAKQDNSPARAVDSQSAAEPEKPATHSAAVSTPEPEGQKTPVQKPKTATVKPKIEKTPTPASESHTLANRGKPEGLAAPREGKKDDLKKIKGIGPKIEGLLNGLGVFHFDQIAAWSHAEVDWVDNYLSFKGRIDRDDWIGQAKELG